MDRDGHRRDLPREDHPGGPGSGAEVPGAFPRQGSGGRVEATTGWRFVVEELERVGAEVHLAEPAEASALKGEKKRAKTDFADARHLRELLSIGRIPSTASCRSSTTPGLARRASTRCACGVVMSPRKSARAPWGGTPISNPPAAASVRSRTASSWPASSWIEGGT
jgi:hypothetical protein